MKKYLKMNNEKLQYVLQEIETFLTVTIPCADDAYKYILRYYDEVFVFIIREIKFINQNIWDLYRMNNNLCIQFNNFIIEKKMMLNNYMDSPWLNTTICRMLRLRRIDVENVKTEINKDRFLMIQKAMKREICYTLTSLHSSKQANGFTEIPMDVIRLIGEMI